MITTRIVKLIGWAAAAFFVAIGLWAFLDARSFYDQLAVFPPYNEHFLHDVGAFQIGIGATLALGMLGWGGMATAFGGAAIGSVFHVAAHVIDSDLGGKDSDPFTLGLLALVLGWAAWKTRPQKSVLRP